MLSVIRCCRTVNSNHNDEPFYYHREMPPECISFKEISKASFDMVEKLEPSHAVGRNEN